VGGIRRRDFIRGGIVGAGALALSPAFLRDALAAPAAAGPGPYGELQPPNAVGLMLPDGFSGRQIARGGQPVAGSGYPWHFAPDGQATYRTLDGGWILVSNSEAPSVTGGGSSAIRFAPDGSVASAYRILAGTNLNCAGGPTPWGTWLSCEEHDGGMVWEADPAGVFLPVVRPALGNFSHEAAAVDPAGRRVYMTEDEPDGGFYRFTPNAYPSLASGALEVAVVGAGGAVSWRRVPDPNVVSQAKPTRDQVPEMTPFDGGEGIWHDRGTLYFTTKGDKKVWAYDIASSTLDLLYVYDAGAVPEPALNAVDNITVSAFGDIYVCEDGGNMEICLITPDRIVSPFCRLVGIEHDGSEMCGAVFDPSGTRLYFSSQRAYPAVPGTPLAEGAVYEVRGPFRVPDSGVPEDRVFGPPAGERGEFPGQPPLPGPSLSARSRIDRSSLAASGLRVAIRLDEPATVDLVLRTPDLESEVRDRRREARPRLVTLARARRSLPAGRSVVPLRLERGVRTRLAGRRSLAATITAAAGDRVVTRPLRIGR
jgi:hypothetical protein